MQNSTSWINRLINYIIDTICIVLIYWLIIRSLPNILQIVPFDFEFDIGVILLLIFVLYYVLLESIFNRTAGKLITRTRVISSMQNQRPTFWQILIRTFVRLFFIEVFSFFTKNPHGWHDKASNTEVVTVK